MNLIVEPFGRIIERENTTKRLDAVYIPTLCNRGKPSADLVELQNYTEEIILLFSNSLPEWIKGLNNRIRVEKISDYNDFSNDYKKKDVNNNPSVKWRSDFDIPLKRSFALYDARKKNKNNILLLDDDILINKGNLITGISGLEHNNAIIGFHVVDYPDVSTLDHFERIVLGMQNTISMTGSCMFINVNKVVGDFANIYNEDLFFFLQQHDNSKIVSGGIIQQKAYDPNNSMYRISHEQFGDLIYEAIKKRFILKNNNRVNWQSEIIE